MAFDENDARQRVKMLVDQLQIANEHAELLLSVVKAFFSDGRQDERRGCLAMANGVMLNAATNRLVEKDVSETGVEFQRGRRVAAEEIIAKLTSRGRLSIMQDGYGKEEEYDDGKVNAEAISGEAASPGLSADVGPDNGADVAGGAQSAGGGGGDVSANSGWRSGFGAVVPKEKPVDRRPANAVTVDGPREGEPPVVHAAVPTGVPPRTADDDY